MNIKQYLQEKEYYRFWTAYDTVNDELKQHYTIEKCYNITDTYFSLVDDNQGIKKTLNELEESLEKPTVDEVVQFIKDIRKVLKTVE